MKFRKCYFPSIFVLFVLLLIFCVPKNEALQKIQTIRDVREKIHLDTDGVSNAGEKKENLASKISSDHEMLSQYFADDEFSKMSDLLGESTYIVSPEGEIIQGPWKVLKYWEKAKKKAEKQNPGKVIKLRVETLRAYITDKTKVVLIEEKKFDSVSYESFLYHIEAHEPEGQVLRNQTGSGSEGRRHRDTCNWENF